jgi:hypothetical protein
MVAKRAVSSDWERHINFFIIAFPQTIYYLILGASLF